MKHEINEQKKDYEDLKKEMKTTIQTLREKLSKAKSQSELNLRYKEKIIETTKATTARIYAQQIQNVQKETERVSKLREREVDVFEKIKSYLEEETGNVSDNNEEWVVSKIIFFSSIFLRNFFFLFS